MVTGCGSYSFAWSGEGCVYNGRIWVACEWGNFWCSCVIAHILLKEDCWMFRLTKTIHVEDLHKAWVHV